MISYAFPFFFNLVLLYRRCELTISTQMAALRLLGSAGNVAHRLAGLSLGFSCCCFCLALIIRCFSSHMLGLGLGLVGRGSNGLLDPVLGMLYQHQSASIG